MHENFCITHSYVYVSYLLTVVYLVLYEDNTDMHFSVYLLVCVNVVLFTICAHA